MASKIKAINAYCPKIKLGRTTSLEQLVEYIGDRTGLNEGKISLVLKELRDAVIFFARQSQSVKIEGLGIYRPGIDLAGVFDMGHLTDVSLKNGLNTPGTFTGEIENRQNIGKTPEELVSRWNSDHPDDPVA